MSAWLSSRLLVCEGFEDKQFFKFIIQAQQLPDFKVVDTSSPPKDVHGGKSKFRRALNGMKTGEHAKRFMSMSHLVIVVDSDETPDDNFLEVTRQVKSVFPRHPPLVAWKAVGANPAISILPVPMTIENGEIVVKHGTLESLCAEAARLSSNPRASNVDAFLNDVGAHNWDATRRGKAWLRSNMAVRAPDPCANFGEIFRDHQNLFDLRDPAIKPLIDFLRTLL